jgi:hypothetical protein
MLISFVKNGKVRIPEVAFFLRSKSGIRMGAKIISIKGIYYCGKH